MYVIICSPPKFSPFKSLAPMIGDNWQLVTDEPVEFDK